MKTTLLKSSLIIVILFIFIFLLTNCKKDKDLTPTPQIDSLLPASGFPGSTIVIKGKNFSDVTDGNKVSFNGTAATIATSSTTTLAVMVPVGATSGKVSVTVNGATAISPVDFTILLPPTITTLSPTYGLPNASVTITGTNFLSGDLIGNKVKFNGTDAIVSAATSTQLTVTVPATATTGKITVSVNGISASSVNDFEVIIDIPRDGLVAFYPFTGNPNDISGNSLNGTAKGNATLSADRYGNVSRAYSFDGTNSYLDMGNPPALQISNKITVAGWANITAFKSPNMMNIIIKIYFDPTVGGNPTKGYEINQDFYGGGVPALSLNIYSANGSTNTSYVGEYVTSSSNPITTNNWMFFALVIDGTNRKFYVNDVKTIDASGSVTLLDDGSLGNLIIGQYSGGFFLNGKVDDVTIYNKSLDATAINTLYNQTITKH